jgi:hypothetical protein
MGEDMQLIVALSCGRSIIHLFSSFSNTFSTGKIDAKASKPGKPLESLITRGGPVRVTCSEEVKDVAIGVTGLDTIVVGNQFLRLALPPPAAKPPESPSPSRRAR